jgi:hypothetical protein
VDEVLAALVVNRLIQPAYGSRGARELQGMDIAEIAPDQPALGSEGARELQGYVVLLTQPADGARAARELQLPMLASTEQPTTQCG